MKFNYVETKHKEFLNRTEIKDGVVTGAEKQMRSLNLREIESNEGDNTKIYVITDSSIDRYMEIVDPNGLDMTDFSKSKKTIFFNHNYSDPIGNSGWEKKVGEEWRALLKFSMATDRTRDVRNLAFDGVIGMTSIGFIPKGLEIAALEDIKDLNPSNRGDYDPKSEVWIWRKAEFLEWSLVGIGANRNANEVEKILAKGLIKSDEVKHYLEVEIEKMLIHERLSENEDLIKSLLAKNTDTETLNTKLQNEINEINKKLTKSVESLAVKKGMSESERKEYISRSIRRELSEKFGKKF